MLSILLSTIVEQRDHSEQILHNVTPAVRFSMEHSHASAGNGRVVMSTIESFLETVASLLLAAESKGTLQAVQESMLSLFRDFWYTVTILGLLSSAHGQPAHRRRSLASIAARTPCLARDLPANYVDSELEFNPILRREAGQVSRPSIDMLAAAKTSISTRTVFGRNYLRSRRTRMHCLRAC